MIDHNKSLIAIVPWNNPIDIPHQVQKTFSRLILITVIDFLLSPNSKYSRFETENTHKF